MTRRTRRLMQQRRRARRRLLNPLQRFIEDRIEDEVMHRLLYGSGDGRPQGIADDGWRSPIEHLAHSEAHP